MVLSADSHLLSSAMIPVTSLFMLSSIKRIADNVSREPSQAMTRTTDLMLEHDKVRAILTNQDAEDYAILLRSQISNAYEIPRYEVLRCSLNCGISYEYMGPYHYADITSHGRPLAFREDRMGMQLDIAEVLNLAAYITTLSSVTKPYIYMLTRRVEDPHDGFSTNIAARLRREYLYDSPAVRKLGPYLLGDAFISNVDSILHNMTTLSHWDEMAVKESMWDCLKRRCRIQRSCPVYGGWKDLIIALRDLPEGWTIYYWMRISMGKFHHKVSNGILAPAAAGEADDLLTMIIKGVTSRAKFWSAYYTTEYKLIQDRLGSENDRIRPHDPEQPDPDEISTHGRSGSYRAEQIQRMVEMQSKSKFFNAVQAFTHGPRIVVGITNENMCEMLIEFYQTRWYSLHKRITKAKSRGQVYTLGSVQLPDHPWGDLVEDLPGSYHEMLQFTMNLDPVGWTLSPDYLQSEFRKAISELWCDIINEIEQVMAYLYEVESGAVEIQDEILAGESSSHASLTLVPPIEIPVQGCMAPYQKPSRHFTIDVDYEAQLATSGIEPLVATTQDVEDESDVEDFELEDETTRVFLQHVAISEVHSSVDTNHVTYRAIWQHLSMPEENDERMRVSFGLPYDFDLNQQHSDSDVGPLILSGEEASIARKWSKKKRLMLKRLGLAVGEVEDEAM